MKIDRILRGGMIALAAALCACAPGESNDTTAGEDTAARSTPAPAAAPASSTAAADTAGSASWVLRADGIGPLRVGMTVDEANRAVGGGLDRTSGLEECDYVRPKTGPAGVSLMVVDGRIARVDVDSTSVATAAGVRLGDTESRAREAYPGARVEPHKYVDGHYVIAIPGAPADTLHRIVFETDGKAVTRMRGGVYPPVEYVEGCS
ncbi:MAG TPA: hypothetical protein VFS20_17220 [Longimicrobium sp.]|nr:hypothetical protein [Longimicrobium sp.]